MVGVGLCCNNVVDLVEKMWSEGMWSEGLYRLAVVLRPFRAWDYSPKGAVYLSDVV
jgi:hypothetical protein